MFGKLYVEEVVSDLVREEYGLWVWIDGTEVCGKKLR
jgi:hypothetical protein